MRKIPLAIAAAVSLVATGSLIPSRAEAVTISTSACPISRKIIIVLLTAAALTAGLIANAFAISGGVSHSVSHPASMSTDAARAIPIAHPTAPIRLRTDAHQHRRRHHESRVHH
jgi:hypothetical protein